MLRPSFALLAVLTLTTALHAQPTDPVDALVRKLGSDSFAQRERARKELVAIGPSALDALRRVQPSDAEAGRRIGDLIAQLEDQLLTQKILSPKMLDLKLEDATVQQAIAEISSKSGYPIQIIGDATPFADKKVTITGKGTFWEAVDRLCEQAGLMEQLEANPIVNPYYAPGGGRILRRPIINGQPQPTPAGPMKLMARTGQPSLVSRAGSVKTDLRVTRDAKTKEIVATLTATLEPSLLNGQIVGKPRITNLIGDVGQTLTANFDAPQPRNDPDAMQWIDFNGMAGPAPTRVATMRVKTDGKRLAELAGNMILQVDMQNVVLAKVEKIMEASGKSVAGANGGTLKIQSVKKVANNAIEMDIDMENLTPNPFGDTVFINGGNVIIRGNINGNIVINGGNVRINGNGNARDLPDLFDADGQKFRVASVKKESTNAFNGSMTRSVTIVYEPASAKAEPRDLILYGTRTHTIAAPFRFENVPLP